MSRIKKLSRLIVVLMLIALFQINIVFAAVSVIRTDKPSTIPVEVVKDGDGILKSLSYVSSSTGATSGIKYRFTETKIIIGDYVYELSFEDVIGGAKPPAGVTEYYIITITREDILEGIEKRYGRKLTGDELKAFEEGLKNPQNISYSATIEIYNANTGKVLDRIDRLENIEKIAKKHGFSKKHMDDMKTRFGGTPLDGDSMNGELRNGEIPKTGLRPTGIVK